MQNKKISEYSKIFQMEFVPILRWMNYGGLEKKLKSLSKRTDEFLQALIDEQRHKEEEGNTMIDHMLSFALLWSNLPDLNHPICEWLNLEKKKIIKKIKVKKCMGVMDEVQKKIGGARRRAQWNVLEFGGSDREKKRGKKRKKRRRRKCGMCVEEKKKTKKKMEKRGKCYHYIFIILSQ